MNEKREIEIKAKALIESSPEEALMLYKEMWEAHADCFNGWDAFFALKAARKCEKTDLEFVEALVHRFPEDEKIKGFYAWIIYDYFINKKPRQQLLEGESKIARMCELVGQNNQRSDDKYRCPVSISVFKMANAYAENLFNARKVNEWLARLNPNLLSAEPRTIMTKEKEEEVEMASDLEKYYALRTKALLKLGEFSACKSFCEQALSEIDKFHYDNDMWFKMRVAICEEKLGNIDASEQLFQELLQTKAGSDKWFLYRDIAELYFEQKSFDKAWKYAVDAAFYGNEPHFLINLYLLQARILFKLGRQEDGKILASLIAAILHEQEWKSKEEYKRLFNFYGMDISNTESVKEVFQKAKDFWIRERYKDKNPLIGKIIFITKNNKVGKIRTSGGKVYDFHRRDLVRKENQLERIKGLEAEFIPMPSYDGKLKAERVKVSTVKNKANDSGIIGLELEGTVKKILEFGMIVSFEKLPDGLLHKSALPEKIRDSFSTIYNPGDRIVVRVVEKSQKGLRLNFVRLHQ